MKKRGFRQKVLAIMLSAGLIVSGISPVSVLAAPEETGENQGTEVQISKKATGESGEDNSDEEGSIEEESGEKNTEEERPDEDNSDEEELSDVNSDEDETKEESTQDESDEEKDPEEPTEEFTEESAPEESTEEPTEESTEELTTEEFLTETSEMTELSMGQLEAGSILSDEQRELYEQRLEELREHHMVTPVKDQSHWGTCWAFARNIFQSGCFTCFIFNRQLWKCMSGCIWSEEGYS